LDLEAQFDSLDDPYFANHGSRLDLRLNLRDPDLGGSTSFRRASTSGRHFFRLTSETVLSVSGEWGMIAGDEVPLLERFFTGGAQYLTFSASPFVGLDRDQILARHHFGSGLAVRHQLRAIPLGLIRKVYVGARYQIGLFNEGEDLRRFLKLLHGVGVGLYLDSTYLGPMALEVGGTDRRDFNVYLSMGYRF
jgi:outer membrane translocation and assembly module TamA